MANHTEIEKCLVCDGTDLVKYLDLGDQPLANNYHKGEKQERYPLQVQLCQKCFHSQLTVAVKPELMFDEYVYVSGTSDTLTQYFRAFVDRVLDAWDGPKPPRVLEIASNDGTLLRMFKERGCFCWGVEPAQNLWPGYEDDLNVWGGYWNKETATHLGELDAFDIVIAVNVLPHVPNPQEFLAACKQILAPGGKVYIQTSQCDMFKNGEFDAIYHEHHSYFTATSFASLCNKVGLTIKAAVRVPIHSMSFLWELGEGDGDHDESFWDIWADENALGWHTLIKYVNFADNARTIAQDLQHLMGTYLQRGTKVVGYGASAKFNTVANYVGIRPAYIVDDNPLKWGLLTPGKDIPIVGPEALENETGELAVLLTAWNFEKEIVGKICCRWPPHASWKMHAYFPTVREVAPVLLRRDVAPSRRPVTWDWKSGVSL